MARWLEFTLTVSPCLGCGVCPQKSLAGAYPAGATREMSPSAFFTILRRLPADVAVHFSGFSEPFLHRDAATLMEAVSFTGRPVHLYTTLMGLRADQLGELAGCHFAEVRLHLPDVKHLLIKPDIWLRQFELFRRTGHRFTAMAMDRVDPAIAAALSDAGVSIEYPAMLSRAGNVWKPAHKRGRIRCAADRWHANVVLPNGDVAVCCMDWSLSMPLGNLLTDDYATIAAKADAYAANDDPPDESICRDCEWCAAV